MKAFTNLYQVAKTLRFELQPIGKTKENIEKGGILKRDEQRAKDYIKVKAIIDEYHKQYIKDRLWNFDLPLSSEGHLDSLEEYQALYEITKRDIKQEANFSEVKDNLRKIIVERLTTKGTAFERIFKKELIREDLPLFVQKEEDKAIINQFEDFTTYCTGFHENRKNMYSAEEKSTAIAYRLIHQNLPKFMDNMKAFALIAQTSVANHFPEIYAGWEKELKVGSIEEIFQLKYFSRTLTQPQIEIYNYIIGKKILEDGREIKGINEYVNLYNQNQKDKSQRLPFLVPLYKQILSEREKMSWLAEEFDSDEKMLSAIDEMYVHLHDLLVGNENESLRSILLQMKDYNLDQINISNDSLSEISQHLFGRYDVFTNGIKDELKKINPQKKKENDEDFENRISKIFKTYKSFSIAFLNKLPQPVMEDAKLRYVEDYYISLGAVNSETTQKENLFLQIENAYENVRAILQMKDTGNLLSQNKPAVAKIKVLLDTFKELQHFIKPLLGSGEENEKDELFYGRFQMIWDELDVVTPLYNKVRNRMTRKPYSNEKFKMTFNIKGNFLGGWVDSKTDRSDNGTQYGGYLFRKKNSIGEYDYYLGVSANTKLFRRAEGVSGQYERLDYYQPKSQTVYGNSYVGKKGYESDKQELMNSIMLYINTIQDENIKQQVQGKDTPSAMITVIKDASSMLYKGLLDDPYFSDVNKRVTNNLHQTILSMSRIPKSKFYQDAKFTVFTEPQQVIEEICKEKVFDYFMVDDKEISDAMADSAKPFLLFKITNKDLSYAEKNEKGLRHVRGTDNLHTMYFKALMNGGQSVLDIGSGEVFYRRASIKANITHPAGLAIKNKNVENKKKESTFDYDLVKDKRYTVDKFGFHLSIIQNYQSPSRFDVNTLTREFIRTNPDVHFIGIDRGERHLLYVSVINKKGQIVEQFSMNVIENEYKEVTYKTDYHRLLEQRGDVRQKERQSWKTIESIKELKQGYLSQVIHKVVALMVKYKAIVVLEDLNPGFKRGRQMVESSVYQKFEKALIDKLNYLVDKQLAFNEPGGLLNGLQLTNKFSSFREMGKQNGFLFYIPAWNTSKMDPVTGFVDLLHPRYENVEKARLFFSKFQRISFNKEKDWFEFTFDYNDFTTKAYGTKTQWTLCTYGERINTFRNPLKNHQWDDEKIMLTEAFKKFFDKYDIDFYGNLKEAIAVQTDAQFFRELLSLMKLLLQMRNSITNSEEDYLLSPVADDSGHFFDSRKGYSNLPINADANGAYNIARKGLYIVRKIQQTAKNEKPSLVISNKDWLLFAQNKPYLKD